MKPKPEDFVTEILLDPETGERVEIKSWKGNTLQLGFIRLTPWLESIVRVRPQNLHDISALCHLVLNSTGTLSKADAEAARCIASYALGKTRLARGRPENVEALLRNHAIKKYVEARTGPGRKQEAAIQAAMEKFGCKRGVVMRALKVR
jgi:hypothetical protein